MKLTILSLSFFVFFLFFITPQISAESSQLSVSPAIKEVVLTPGKKQEVTVSLRNGSENAFPVTLQAESIISKIDADRYKSRYDASSWVTFDTPTFLIEPMSSKQVTFTVDTPQDASPGGHYATVSVQALSLEQTSDKQTKSIILPEVAINLLMTVPGDIIEDFDFSNEKISPLITRKRHDIETSFVARNTGNVHNILTAHIVIYKDDKEIDKIPIRPSVILPETEETFKHSWKAPDDYGIYDVSVQYSYGSAQISESISKKTVVLPNIWLIVFGVLLLFVALYIYSHRNNVGKALAVLRRSSS